jgi:hypothetical protein
MQVTAELTKCENIELVAALSSFVQMTGWYLCRRNIGHGDLRWWLSVKGGQEKSPA